MHVYLPEKYRSPFLHGALFSTWSSLFFMEFSFSQKFESLIVSFDGSFRSCLLESSLVILTPRKDLISSYFLVLRPLSQWLPTLPDSFLERESWSQLYQMLLIALQLDHAPKYANQVWGWGYVKESLVIYKELFSQITFGISKLFRIKIILMFV